jgi:acyl-CoA hydrolase
MSYHLMTAEELQPLCKTRDNVGFSGFTPAGSPKAVLNSSSRVSKERTEKGNPLKLGCFTGASTGDSLTPWQELMPRLPYTFPVKQRFKSLC